jgi:beta-glucosidase
MTGFLWGAATSSHQIEGENRHNDWWQWEQEGHIDGGARSGRATDHWNRFREDLALAASLGLNSYRFSVEWSRIEPEPGRWNREAIEWYRELIAECERLGLVPMLTLHHFTSPRWFAERGGFTWSEAPARFATYVRYVARELGASVPLWCTFNEPMVLVSGTYLGQFMPSARFSPKDASLACHHLLRAHVLGYDLLHAELGSRQSRRGPWKDLPISVGIAHNMLDFLPARSLHPIERVIAFAFWRVYNQAWLDAITGRKQRFGVPGLMPFARPVLEALGRRTCDFIGVNYYTKAYVEWCPREAVPENPASLPIGVAFGKRKEEVSDLGWAIHPEGFHRVLMFAHRYGLPIYVTENGIADREDRRRPAYLRSHLQAVARAIRDGADIRGYYHWSLLDNFEWIKGFGPRFGLFRVDYATFERTPTRSAELYREIIRMHRARGDTSPDEALLEQSADGFRS